MRPALTSTRLSKEVRARLRRKPADSEGQEDERPACASEHMVHPDGRNYPTTIPDTSISHVREGDIGPTIRGASSIERLFAPRSVGPIVPETGDLCRSDPIGYGYVNEILARGLFDL